MKLNARFLNVGNGDCTIIRLPNDTTTVVDVRNARSNRREAAPGFENPIRHLEALRESSIDRYIQTHPEMDHLDGFSDVVDHFTITNFWDTANNRPKPTDFSHGFRESDWDAYQNLRRNGSPLFHTRNTQGVSLKNGNPRPYDIFALSPSEELVADANKSGEWNTLSYVILLRFGPFKLLLGGDASDIAWQDLYEWTEKDIDARKVMKGITVFKASHHGRNSSYCGAEMLDLMNPQQIVISKGSVPGEQSAYGNYYNWAGGSDRMFLTSQGTVAVDYDSDTNRYTIGRL